MVCVVNVESVERIICSIVNRFNLEMGPAHPSAIDTPHVTSPTCGSFLLVCLIVKGYSCARTITVVE